MHNARHVEIGGTYLTGQTGERAPLKGVVVHGVGEPQCVEVEVHGVGDLHGVVEGSRHVCGEVVHCVGYGVSHAWVVLHVCRGLVHDLQGVVEEVCDEGDLPGVVNRSDYVHGGGGAEGEEAHRGEVHDHGAVCQVWELLLAGSSAASARAAAGRGCDAPLVHRALESEVAGHACGGEEGILFRVWDGGAQDHVRDGDGAHGVRDSDGARGVREVPLVGGDRGVIAAQYGKIEDDDDRGGVSAGHA